MSLLSLISADMWAIIISYLPLASLYVFIKTDLKPLVIKRLQEFQSVSLREILLEQLFILLPYMTSLAELEDFPLRGFHSQTHRKKLVHMLATHCPTLRVISREKNTLKGRHKVNHEAIYSFAVDYGLALFQQGKPCLLRRVQFEDFAIGGNYHSYWFDVNLHFSEQINKLQMCILRTSPNFEVTWSSYRQKNIPENCNAIHHLSIVRDFHLPHLDCFPAVQELSLMEVDSPAASFITKKFDSTLEKLNLICNEKLPDFKFHEKSLPRLTSLKITFENCSRQHNIISLQKLVRRTLKSLTIIGNPSQFFEYGPRELLDILSFSNAQFKFVEIASFLIQYLYFNRRLKYSDLKERVCERPNELRIGYYDQVSIEPLLAIFEKAQSLHIVGFKPEKSDVLRWKREIETKHKNVSLFVNDIKLHPA